TLGANTVLNGTDIKFVTTLDSAGANRTLQVNGSGVTTFGGVVGGTLPLASLTTDASGSTAINGGAVTTTGGQTYNDTVTLGANTVVASTSSGNLTFAKTVDADAVANNRTLVANTAGTTTFRDVVGGNQALKSVTTDAAGSTVIGDATVNVNMLVKTTGDQTYNDAVRIGANVKSSSVNGGTIAFHNTVDSQTAGSEKSLEVNSLGNEIFDAPIGAVVALTKLSTDADLAIGVGGEAQFNMTVAPVGTVGGVNAGSVVVNDAAKLNIAGGTIANPSIKTTSGGQTFVGAVTLQQSAVLTDIAGKNIEFDSTVDGPASLTANTAGNEIFNGKVGSVSTVANLTTDADPANRGGKTVLNVAGTSANPSVRTLLNQTYNDAIELQKDTVLATVAAGDITFNSTVDANAPGANRAFQVITSGKIQVSGDVGAGANGPLGAVTFDNGDALTGNGLIAANTLFLKGICTVGSSAARLRTKVTTLDLNKAGGDTFIAEQDDLLLQGSTAANLDIVSGGNIGQVAALSVNSGLMTLKAESAGGVPQNINLGNANNDFKSVKIVNANDVLLTDVNALQLDDVTVQHNLTLNSGGPITQVGGKTVIARNGLTTVNAQNGAGTPQDVTLANAGNDFKTFSVVKGQNVTIKDINKLTFGSTTVAGNLTATVGGDIDQVPGSTISITGDTSLILDSAPASPAPVTFALNSQNNVFQGRVHFTDLSSQGQLQNIDIYDGSDFVIDPILDAKGDPINWKGTLKVHTAPSLATATFTISQSGPFVGTLDLLANKIVLMNAKNRIYNRVLDPTLANVQGNQYSIYDDYNRQSFGKLPGEAPMRLVPDTMLGRTLILLPILASPAGTPQNEPAITIDPELRKRILSDTASKPVTYINGLNEYLNGLSLSHSQH
ncbi:MAG: hypothetical protein WCO56_27880, partial [Verrucomicrobiota bacterium]